MLLLFRRQLLLVYTDIFYYYFVKIFITAIEYAVRVLKYDDLERPFDLKTDA